MENSTRISVLLFLNHRGEISPEEEKELSDWRQKSYGNELLFQETINADKVRDGMRKYYSTRDNIFEKIKLEYPGFASANISDSNFPEEGFSDEEPIDDDMYKNFYENEPFYASFSKADYWSLKLRRSAIEDGENALIIEDTPGLENMDWKLFASKFKTYLEADKISKKKKARIFRIVGIAASFLILLGAGLYFILNGKQNSEGSYRAELIDTDGVHTALNDFHRGYLAGSAGIKIEKRENGELVYIAKNYPDAGKDKYYDLYTAKGGTFSMKLPDGSMIWLNALSSIKYPANFSLDSIKIMLEGEAYFELAKDAKHSFIISVTSSVIGQRSSVNGSTVNGFKITSTSGHFNIRSFEDDPIVSATMVEGTALVWLDSVHSELQILPGQQAQLLDGKLNLVAAADTSEIIAWKNGEFYYKDASLPLILPALAKWYDVDIQYGSQIPNKKISLRIPRSTPISEVLDNLRKQGLHITQRGKIITIWK